MGIRWSCYLGHTLDHVFDVGADSPNSSQFLGGPEPFLHYQLLLSQLEIEKTLLKYASKQCYRCILLILLFLHGCENKHFY